MQTNNYHYTKRELDLLQQHLYMITEKILEICDKHHIQYFIIGGTAIGAYYWEGFIPWDDDIDIGMTRNNYERFLTVAPQELGNKFFLQWYGTEKNTPFWFAKVRENGTLFRESWFRNIQMHHGIYVDIFPFDKIPKNKLLYRIQSIAFGFINTCFIGKSIWQWKYCGRCEVDTPRKRGFLPCLLTRLIVTFFSKDTIFRMLCYTQTMFNNRAVSYCKNIMTTNDIVAIEDVRYPRVVNFGRLKMTAPRDLEKYLHTHYPILKKYLPQEEQINHRPAELSFGQ
jgi:lipopolysaccharide cholinephosphotransferase